MHALRFGEEKRLVSLLIWWSQAGSNRRPLECHSVILIAGPILINSLRRLPKPKTTSNNVTQYNFLLTMVQIRHTLCLDQWVYHRWTGEAPPVTVHDFESQRSLFSSASSSSVVALATAALMVFFVG